MYISDVPDDYSLWSDTGPMPSSVPSSYGPSNIKVIPNFPDFTFGLTNFSTSMGDLMNLLTKIAGRF